MRDVFDDSLVHDPRRFCGYPLLRRGDKMQN
jgi:hypothetical protein